MLEDSIFWLLLISYSQLLQVLIDESTQATEPECLIPLVLGAKQVSFGFGGDVSAFSFSHGKGEGKSFWS